MTFNVDYLSAGDTFEGGPIEQSYFILAVMAAGGEVEIDGDKVLILQLPKTKDLEIPAEVAAIVEATIHALTKEEETILSPAEDLAAIEEAVIEELVIHAPTPLQTDEDGNPVSVPKKRGRKPAVSSDPLIVE